MTQKTAIVTGASSGIGAAIAEQLINQQYQVIGLARDFSKCSFRSDLFVTVNMDFSNINSLPEQLTNLTKKYTDVDALICCTGRGQFGSLEEFSYPQIQSLMELNFLSQAFVSKAFIPGMKRRGHGDIIYIGSESALNGGRKGAIYCASKFALRGMAQSLREECGRNGVRVTLINPGMVKTPFFDSLEFEPGMNEENYILPGDIAETVAMVLSSRRETVFDEINLSPLTKVIQNKPK